MIWIRRCPCGRFKTAAEDKFYRCRDCRLKQRRVRLRQTETNRPAPKSLTIR